MIADSFVFTFQGETALYVGPDLTEGLPAKVLEGLARRRQVAVGAECPPPCGARLLAPSRAVRRAAARAGQVMHVAVEHEDDCAAICGELDAYIAVWGAR